MHKTQDGLGLGSLPNYCDMVLKSQKNSPAMHDKVIVTNKLWVFQAFFFMSGSNLTAHIVTSPSENENESYTEIEGKEYQEFLTTITYPEQQNENPMNESAAYRTVSSIWQVWTICLSPYLDREDKYGRAGRMCKTSLILFLFSDRGLLGFQWL